MENFKFNQLTCGLMLVYFIFKFGMSEKLYIIFNIIFNFVK